MSMVINIDELEVKLFDFINAVLNKNVILPKYNIKYAGYAITKDISEIPLSCYIELEKVIPKIIFHDKKKPNDILQETAFWYSISLESQKNNAIIMDGMRLINSTTGYEIFKYVGISSFNMGIPRIRVINSTKRIFSVLLILKINALIRLEDIPKNDKVINYKINLYQNNGTEVELIDIIKNK